MQPTYQLLEGCGADLLYILSTGEIHLNFVEKRLFDGTCEQSVSDKGRMMRQRRFGFVFGGRIILVGLTLAGPCFF